MKQNILLAEYTTFKIGGPAKHFCEAKSAQDLIKAVKAAKKAEVPLFILGGGSNVLVSDKGFDGLVIRIRNTKYEIRNTKIFTDAGVLLSKLVDESVKAGLTGLEWAAGIPGTVGGAVRGNAGAFGVSMSDATKTVTVLEIPNNKFQITNKSQIPNPKIKTLKNKDCQFEYRESIFKENRNLIILSVEIELNEGDKELSKKVIKRHLAYRKKHQPPFPSAGCVFKNFPDKSAGYLIEQCGLRGKKIGRAMIYKEHGNFIVNTGDAKAKDVKKLIDLCKEKVREKFGIKLEEEIEYLGEF